MIPIAMITAPRPGKIASRVAVATRSDGACWIGLEGQRDEIRDVGQQIQRDDDDRAEGERERDVAARLFHFAGGERDVVPGISREERPTWATQSAISMP
jgi:hypothetical protein